MKKETYKILKKNENQPYYNIPIYLTSSLNEMGVMVQFDGYIEEINQVTSFLYYQFGNMVYVVNTSKKIEDISEKIYTISWGDGYVTTINGSNTTPQSHTYINDGIYTITLKSQNDWGDEKTEKVITVPNDITKPNPLGTFTGIVIPEYSNLSGQTQNYIHDLDYTNNTGHSTHIICVSLGKSRISELKRYGTNLYDGVSIGNDSVGNFSAYTIDNFYYKDYDDGYTMISGTSIGYTKEEIFNQVITRNEHFLGFIEEPTIYSDVFIERGKQSVMEKNLRLGDINSVGELDVYQNGYFIVKKQ